MGEYLERDGDQPSNGTCRLLSQFPPVLHKVPQTGGLNTTETNSLRDLETGRPKSRCGHLTPAGEKTCLPLWHLALLAPPGIPGVTRPHTAFSLHVRVCVLISSSHKDTGHVGLRTHPDDLI